jgi:hypothetical protein
MSRKGGNVDADPVLRALEIFRLRWSGVVYDDGAVGCPGKTEGRQDAIRPDVY